MKIAESAIGTSPYGDWVMDTILGQRAPADPELLRRAIGIVAASSTKLPTDEERQIIFMRLSMQPELHRVIRKADELREALGIEVLANRSAGNVTFTTAGYCEALRRAFEQGWTELADNAGLNYEVRQLMAIRTRTSGVVIAQGTEIIAYDFDWRSRLATAGSRGSN